MYWSRSVQAPLGGHDRGVAEALLHDLQVSSAGGGAADRAEPGALDDDIDVNVDVGGVTGMVPGAEVLHEIAFRAGVREVDDVHLVTVIARKCASSRPAVASASSARGDDGSWPGSG